MPLQLIRADITEVSCDAMVNATDPLLSGDGGVDGAIQRAGGSALRRECRSLGRCRPGEVRVTAGYQLPCRYVLHAAVPVWQGGGYLEKELLSACYREAFRMAEVLGCERIALPLLGAGASGFPVGEALAVAEGEIEAYLDRCDAAVLLVLFDRAAVLHSRERYADLQSYIDDHYAEEHYPDRERRRRWEREHLHGAAVYGERIPAEGEDEVLYAPAPKKKPRDPGKTPSSPKLFSPKAARAEKRPIVGAVGPSAPLGEAVPFETESARSLEEALASLDESFSQMLLRKIDEKGMKDSDCYKRANVDRKLFSKIRTNVHYRPSKPTALAFAVALELPLPETEDLLKKAGYALSHSSIFDVIVEYFIQKGDYDVFAINEALFAYDQSLLGAG